MRKNELKAITNIPGWADAIMTGQTNRVKSEVGAFDKVPLVRRAVEIRCNAIAAMPYSIENSDG